MIHYQKITKETEKDLQIPNEPFTLFGQLVVSRTDNEWLHEIKEFETVEEMCFPNEDYTFEEVDKKGFAIGAYEGSTCVGLAIFESAWNKYLYLMDLKVNSDFRKKGIAARLIQLGQDEAQQRGYKGIYTVAQDNNLAACQFYLRSHFIIGGLDTMVYQHTSQEGKADIYFYLDN